MQACTVTAIELETGGREREITSPHTLPYIALSHTPSLHILSATKMSPGAKPATPRSVRRPGRADAHPLSIASPTRHTESGTNIWALLKSIPVSSQNDLLAENPADALGIPRAWPFELWC